MKILFVCLGNICRSPLAEGIMKHKFRLKGLDDKFIVDSCGTSNYHIGDKPDLRTRRNAEQNGVKLNHFGRQLTQVDLENFDLIVAMDQSNKTNILRMCSTENSGKVKLMREFDPKPGDDEVPDPYYGDESDFQQVFDILDRSTDGLMVHLAAKGLL